MGVKTLIAVPCMEMVNADFMFSMLGLVHAGECQFSRQKNSLVYDARNTMAGRAIQGGFDRVLWLDSDMVFGPDLLVRLSKDMDEGREMVTAACFKRKPPFHPTLYKKLTWKMEEKNHPVFELEEYLDYPKDEIFQVAGCGCGALMMTTDLIAKVGEEFGFPFSPLMGFGEDLTFCWRVGQLGVPIWCDSRIKVGHQGMMTVSEETYLTQRQEETTW